jgi:hypothetical protein
MWCEAQGLGNLRDGQGASHLTRMRLASLLVGDFCISPKKVHYARGASGWAGLTPSR